MATLKFKHFILFLISFALLIYSEFPGGALLSLLAWMQLSLLLWKQKFTAKNQMKFFILFLSLIPTYFLWGAVNSFISIYAKESHFIFVLMYGLLSFVVCFWITLFSVFSYAYAKHDDTLLEVYSNCISEIKNQKFVFMYISLLVFLISIAPIPITADYRIVIGIISAHLFLQKTALVSMFKQN